MYAVVDDTSPQTASRCGEKRLSKRPSNSPCASAEATPTANSDQPFASGPQPNLKVVYSTQVVYSTNCASPAQAITATSKPTPLVCDSARSEATGFAARHSKR